MNNVLIYEEGKLVGKSSNIKITVTDSSRTFRMEDITILPDFHLLNGPENPYHIEFYNAGSTGSMECIFTGRSPVSESYDYLQYLEGNFTSLYITS